MVEGLLIVLRVEWLLHDDVTGLVETQEAGDHDKAEQRVEKRDPPEAFATVVEHS